MITVVRPVGSVQIDCEMRIPAIEQPHKRLSLRGLELHIIAVQIHPLRVLADTYAAERAVLRGAILNVDLFIAVRIVDRCYQDNQPVEQRAHVAKNDTPCHVLHSFLSFDFTGVDVRKDEDYRFA